MNPLQQEHSTQAYPRIGKIHEIHSDKTRVKVNFHGNPIGQPIWAVLGRAFKKSDIDFAIDNQLRCQINFMDGDLSLPVLVDIFTSLLEEDLLILRAKKMVIQGEESITLRSGETQVAMTAKSGSVKTTAQNINTSADKLQKIQATKVRLN